MNQILVKKKKKLFLSEASFGPLGRLRPPFFIDLHLLTHLISYRLIEGLLCARQRLRRFILKRVFALKECIV